MKKLSLITAILLLSSSWVLAQSSTQPTANAGQYPGSGQQSTQQPDKSQKSDKGEQTIEGCLSGGANVYLLTDATGRTYELLDDTRQLDKNVGHQVRLWGSLGSTGGGAAISAPGPQAIFGVKKVKSLSDKCK
jgi:uncharacterized protein YdeI (BOF family)